MIFNAGTEASGVRNPNHAHTPAPYNGWDERAGMKRKAISKRVRFEVFKRDSFKCQYCGKCAPDVVLHVDHIDPVSNGGDNEIMNLVTACVDCNLGKSDKALDDSSAIERQRKQLEELNERREQIELMLEWRNALKDMDEDVVSYVVDAIEDSMNGHTVNDSGRAHVRKWLKTFSTEELIYAIDQSSNRFLRSGEEDYQGFFDNIPKRAGLERKPETERKALYVRGILRNRLSYVNHAECLRLIKGAVESGYSIESITDFAKTVKTWTAFRDELEGLQNG